MDTFLKRAEHFVNSIFTITYVDAMNGKCQERLARFLTSPAVAASGTTLHCVQTEESMLHRAPWVQERVWDSSTHNAHAGQDWKDLIVDGVSIDEVSVVVSDVCGAGKSRLVRSRVQDSASGPLKITVHEQSSISSLLHALSTAASRSIHISFGCLPERPVSPRNRWFDMIDSFFFSVLVLRLHSNQSNLRVFVELPSTGKENHTNWLPNYIPSLALCATLLVPNEEAPFELNDEAYRVCLYLRALRDKTINRKFKPHVPKQIVLVIDVSGSMQGRFEDGRTVLEVAVDNALVIFDGHVGVNDVSDASASQIGVLRWTDLICAHFVSLSVSHCLITWFTKCCPFKTSRTMHTTNS